MRSSSLPVAAAVLAVACIAAAPPGQIFFPGRQYGVGERQTYLIDRNAHLTVRFAKADGSIATSDVVKVDESSVAFTVEGYDDAGMPVLALAKADLKGGDSAIGGSTATASPVIENDGSVRSETFADLAPAGALLNGLDTQSMDIGTNWNGRADVALPFARAALRLDGHMNFKSGDQQSTLLQALLGGAAGVSGHPNVAPFGPVTLVGGGVLTGSAFFSPERRLMLGMDLTLTSTGNVTGARGRRGSYTLRSRWMIKLAHYAPGVAPGPGISPGIGIPVTQMGPPAPAATNVYSQGSPANVFSPASMNPDIIDRSNASAPPTAEPSPDESLPPVPISMPSDQPVASPPPGPTPTAS
ncbi:MAG TPA: hypothetical protein VJN22_08295 [Candidatus Eremiobacteraceae bacterium]|nr:hypothetical protein [Candidatus Eremiobacteraceae bacterium]